MDTSIDNLIQCVSDSIKRKEYKNAFKDGFNAALKIIKCDIDDLDWKDCFPRE